MIQCSLNRSSSSSNSGASQSINTVCVALETDSVWKVVLNHFAEQKLLIFLAFLLEKVNICIQHKYKSLFPHLVWQYLLHKVVFLIPRYRTKFISVVSLNTRNDQFLFQIGLSSGKIIISFFLHSCQGTTMRKLQLKWLISSSFRVHVDNAERYHLGQEMPRGL